MNLIKRLNNQFTELGLLLLVLLIISIGSVLILMRNCSPEPQPMGHPKPTVMKADCLSSECHSRKMAMTNYFEKAGNPHPEEMADAVLATKKPKLLAAIAVKGEFNTPYTVRKAGWKRRHSGAWQVSEQDWGKVPYSPKEQALQAENILDELTDTRPLKQALNKYGGDSTDAYSQRVLAELQRVP